MKKVTYTCNLCWEEKQPKKLLCLYWKSDIKPHYELTSNLQDSDKHICDKCREIIINTKPEPAP